eukprot:350868-Chlamydomonas_euryale.AAC.5
MARRRQPARLADAMAHSARTAREQTSASLAAVAAGGNKYGRLFAFQVSERRGLGTLLRGLGT